MKIRLAMFSLAGLLILLDQGTKFLIRQTRPNIQVIPGFFNMTYVENRGAAFGILQGKIWLLIIVSLIASAIFVFLILRENPERKGFLIALSLILGGTCGNLIDRARLNYVVDFLDFHIKQHHWPSFNIADSAISTGVGLLIIVTLWEEFTRDKQQETP